MQLKVEFDEPTARKVAAFFEQSSMLDAAIEMWRALCRNDPFERSHREKLGGLLFDAHQAEFPVGSIPRSHFLLDVIGRSFPSERLSAAYFENLELLLKSRVKRTQPGDVILGIGSGRCGSTSLSAAFANLFDACSTHENPPMIYWEPVEEQVRFHLKRLRLMSEYFSIVFDAAHWWLNVLDRIFDEFPAAKVIGLVRDNDACAQSFSKIKGSGPGSLNHWAAAPNQLWATSLWDPAYPKYPVPSGILPGTGAVDAAKADMIRRYVSQYNQTLATRAQTLGGRLQLIRTEALNDPATTSRLSEMAARPLMMPRTAMNAGTIADGTQAMYRL